ncbi:hypothetical protein DHD05_05920 [Arenibacter sp. N53]|nr:hypothetical protein [Arenibacter sp. N53]
MTLSSVLISSYLYRYKCHRRISVAQIIEELINHLEIQEIELTRNKTTVNPVLESKSSVEEWLEKVDHPNWQYQYNSDEIL